jgi:hypothetical protein
VKDKWHHTDQSILGALGINEVVELQKKLLAVCNLIYETSPFIYWVEKSLNFLPGERTGAETERGGFECHAIHRQPTTKARQVG